MADKQLHGDDAFAELTKMAEQQNVTPQEVPEVEDPDKSDGGTPELPEGYELNDDLRQKHMLEFAEQQAKGAGRFNSFVGTFQNAVEAAIKAGWFVRPQSLYLASLNKDEASWNKALDEIGELKGDQVKDLASIIFATLNGTYELKKKKS